MRSQITVIEHCHGKLGAKKQVARSFKAIAPHSKIHIRNRKGKHYSVYILNSSSTKEQITLLRFAFRVAQGIFGKKPEEL